jgi:glycosyltransferase involved in cell wall biosynthesis
LQAPDSDTAEARSLAVALRAEGFAAEVVSSVDELGPAAPDLVHLFGVRPGGFARRVADWANEHRKPLIVHALHESPAKGGYWGALVAPICFSYSGDDLSVSRYLEMLAGRAVEVDGIGPDVPYAPPVTGVPDAERVLALADVVLVNSQRELAVVEALRPRRQTFIVPPLPTTLGLQGGPIGALVGTDPFVLVHAPIWPEANQLVLARAAASLDVATVFAGAVADPVYAERLREFAPERVVLLDEPPAELVPSLYRAAAVVADAAWTTRGHGALATAAGFGAAIVCSQNRWLDLGEGEIWTVDPANAASVARGMGEAWDAVVHTDQRIRTAAAAARERLGPAAAVIVAAYAKIAQAV